MNTIELNTKNGGRMRIVFLNEKLARISFVKSGEFTDTGLNRYGFLTEYDTSQIRVKTDKTRDGRTMESGHLRIAYADATGELIVTDTATKKTILHQTGLEFDAKQATVRFRAEKDENWVGFGDQTRERLYHRGHTAECYIRNVVSYIPVPFFMSTRGAGVLVNTTHPIFFDMCKTDPDHFMWRDRRGCADYYVMAGSGFRELLETYTELTGRPKLPPSWSFGLWFTCREDADDHEVVSTAYEFRRYELPCDAVGLEPGWQHEASSNGLVRYNYSLEKNWALNRFHFPPWNYKSPYSFIGALKRMGFHLHLWLCCDYDFSYEEERRVKKDNEKIVEKEPEPEQTVFHKEAEMDAHFLTGTRYDQTTKKDEPWFEHLKKFVDQGADFWHLDASAGINPHPDRMWGNGMPDAEMHNLYFLLFARQMHEGFEEYTGRRPLGFIPCGWAGIQAWAGTWTGDTGGKLDTLGGILNNALAGQSWCTVDMEVTENEGIHYGYLLPWSEINSWKYFRMPWFQGKKLAEAHKYYSRLRSRLFPYLYSWGFQATRTGYPLLIPLTLEFEHDPKCRDNLHQYLLGRDLLVCIYEQKAYFPEGQWKDYWTGEVVGGGQEKAIAWPADRGGGLYVRRGGIIPHGPVMQYRAERPLDEIELYVFPDNKESGLDYYEDDGVSLKHREGEYAITRIQAQDTGKGIKVQVGPTRGSYAGMPSARRWSFTVAVDFTPSEVTVNGKAPATTDWAYDKPQGLVRVKQQTGIIDLVVKR